MARLFNRVGEVTQRVVQLLSPYPTLEVPDDQGAEEWVTRGRTNLRGHDSEPRPTAPQTPEGSPPAARVETEPA